MTHISWAGSREDMLLLRALGDVPVAEGFYIDLGADIHFLKIDVEGHEEPALRGMDFTRFRPWILCIEATKPARKDIPTFAAWEPLVTGGAYRFALFDGVNRWYVAEEHPERLPAFAYPTDNYIPMLVLRHIHSLETRVRELEAR